MNSHQNLNLSQAIFFQLKSNDPKMLSSVLNVLKKKGDFELIKDVFSSYFCSLQGNDFSNPMVLKTATGLIEISSNLYPLWASTLSLNQFKFLLKLTDNNIKVNYQGHTLLHDAILTAYDELIALTIDQGSVNSVDMADNFNNTPLHIAIANECYEKAIKLIKVAKEKNISIDFAIADKEKKTTLILSAKMRASHMVEFILNSMDEASRKQVVNLQDEDGKTALHYAMILGAKETVQGLLQAGASEDIKDKRGFKPRDYLSIPKIEKEALIKKTLKSVSIDYTRDENARSNSLLGPYYDMPSTLDGQSIEISSRKENSGIEKLLRHDLLDVKEFYDTGKFTKLDNNFFRAQYNKFTGRSFLAACINGHNDLDENISNENKPNVQGNVSLFSHANPDPMKLYEQGVKDFNKDKTLAKNKFEMALKLFEEKGLSDSLECGKCYSSLASCFRDLKLYDDAISACEKAMPIYNQICPNSSDNKKLETKYNQCLQLKNEDTKIEKKPPV